MQSLSNFNKNIFFLVGNKYAQVSSEKNRIRDALKKLLEDNKKTQKYKTQNDFVRSSEYVELTNEITDTNFILTLSDIISLYFETSSDGNEEFVADTLLKENSIFYILLTKLNALVKTKLSDIITNIHVAQESILAAADRKELYDTAINDVSADISKAGLFVIDDFFGLIKSPLATYYLQHTDILKQADERIYLLAQDFFRQYEGKPFSNLYKPVNSSNRSTQFYLSTISELKESAIEHKMVIILLLEDFIEKVESNNPWAITFLTAQIKTKINKKVGATWTSSEEVSTELTISDKIKNRLVLLDMSIISDGSLIKEAVELYEEYNSSLELMEKAAKGNNNILKIIKVLKESLDQSYHALEDRVTGWKNIFDHSASTFKEENQEILSSLFIGNDLTYIFDSNNGSIEKNPLYFKLKLKIDPGTSKLISSSNVIKLSMNNLKVTDSALNPKKVQQTAEDAEDIEESEEFIENFLKIQDIEEDSKEVYIDAFKDFVKKHPSILFMKYLHKGVKQDDKSGKESKDPGAMFKRFSKTNSKEHALVIDIQDAIKKYIRDSISAMQKSLNLTDDAIHCFNTIGFPSLTSKISQLDHNDPKYKKYKNFREILKIIAAGAHDSGWSLMGESNWKIPLYISRALNNIQEHDDMDKVIGKCNKKDIDKIAQDKLDSDEGIDLLVIAQHIARGLSASRTVTNNAGIESMRQEVINFFNAHSSVGVVRDLFDKKNKIASCAFFDKTPYSLDIKINEHIKMMARQVYIG